MGKTTINPKLKEVNTVLTGEPSPGCLFHKVAVFEEEALRMELLSTGTRRVF